VTTRIDLDDTDRSIIRELQRDGRISYADLAPLAGLSAPATRQRVQRLMDSGLLQVVAVTDPLALGLPVMAMVGINVDGDIRDVAERIAEVRQLLDFPASVLAVKLLGETLGGHGFASLVAAHGVRRPLNVVEIPLDRKVFDERGIHERSADPGYVARHR
jgi:DNA-binding Lrp family transcriptional regulator